MFGLWQEDKTSNEKRLLMKNKELKRRIIDISYKLGLSHIGSCLSAVDIIADIYEKKKPEDKFVLSAGHAHLAHLIVMEDQYATKSVNNWTEQLIKDYGIHCDRQAGCDVSTGSLGQGISVALGIALANKERNVYVLCSDGETREGVFWECLRIAKDLYLENLHVYVNINGWGAMHKINTMQLANQLEYMSWAKPIDTNLFEYPGWLQGQEAHYKVLKEHEYKELMELLQ